MSRLIEKHRAANSRPFSCCRIKAATLFFILLIILPVHAVRADAYFSVDTFAYSEPVPVDAMINKWNKHFSRGEDALTYNRIELGFTYQGFGIGVLKRYDIALEFSKDTSEFYYLTDNKLPLPVGKQYELDLQVKQTFSDGIRVNRTFQLNPQLKTNVGFSYLRGLWLMQGRMKGNATVVGDKDYDFNFDVNYVYSEDALFDRNVDKPNGQGFSIDVDIDWKITDATMAHLQVLDLLARMYWDNAPVTTATATSSTKSYDDDGYVIYNPALSGYEKYKDYTQKLPPKITAELTHQLQSEYSMLLRSRIYETRSFYQLGLQYSFNDEYSARALYMLEVKAVTLAFQSKYFRCLLTTDSFQFDETHIFALQMQAHIPF